MTIAISPASTSCIHAVSSALLRERASNSGVNPAALVGADVGRKQIILARRRVGVPVTGKRQSTMSSGAALPTPSFCRIAAYFVLSASGALPASAANAAWRAALVAGSVSGTCVPVSDTSGTNVTLEYCSVVSEARHKLGSKRAGIGGGIAQVPMRVGVGVDPEASTHARPLTTGSGCRRRIVPRSRLALDFVDC